MIPKRAVQDYWADKLHSSGLGAGLRATTPGTSACIYDSPHHWKRRDYIGAIQLRIELLRTKGAPYIRDTDCRNPAYEGTRETLYQVLQRCLVTHYTRINRRDNIRKTVKKATEKSGYKFKETPRFTTKAGTYAPDLIAIKDNKGYIIETTVANESKSNSTDNAYKIKCEKYNAPDLIQKIKSTYVVKEVKVLPFVVGTRRNCPSPNDSTFSTFHLSKGLRAVIATSALQ